MARRLTGTMKRVRLNEDNLWHNLILQQGLIVAEPLHIILAALGHPNAHEKVRQLTLRARAERSLLQELVLADPEIQPYFEKMTPAQKKILACPSGYTDIASQKATQVAKK